MWFRMPHHKRFSTPISVQEAEEALVIGYWTRDNLDDEKVTLCLRHLNFLELLDGKLPEGKPLPPLPTAPVTGPVTNGNLPTSPPPLPVVKLPAIATVLEPIREQSVKGESETRAVNCPLCHKLVAQGQVHSC